jgi:hypothetical protein
MFSQWRIISYSLISAFFNPFQDEREAHREQCRGMYSKGAMGGSIDPYINIIFPPINGDEEQIVSLVVFAWSDVLDVGIYDDNGEVNFLCCT